MKLNLVSFKGKPLSKHSQYSIKMAIVRPVFVVFFLSTLTSSLRQAERRNNYFNSDEVFWNNIEWDSNPRLQNHNMVWQNGNGWNRPERARQPWRKRQRALRKRKQQLANQLTTTDNWQGGKQAIWLFCALWDDHAGLAKNHIIYQGGQNWVNIDNTIDFYPQKKVQIAMPKGK